MHQILVSFAAALTSALDDRQIQEKYGLVPGLMVNPLNPKRYEKGTLIFDVLNPQISNNASNSCFIYLTPKISI
jgi:hypothetical protein